MHPFSPERVSIFKRSVKYRSTALVELAQAHIESLKGAASFEKDGIKENLLRVASNNGVWKAHLRQLLSDARRKR